MAAIYEIYEPDDGKWSVGLWDEAAIGPFETRPFAEAVAGRNQTAPAPRTRFRRINIRGVGRDAS
jgi:hypothetical protein